MKKINLDYLALGQNIGSSSFKRFYRVSAKAHLTVSPSLNEILIGSMLGDLTVEKPNLSCNARIQFKQSIINKDYIEHMYELFKEFCGSKPLVMSKFDTRPTKNKEMKTLEEYTLGSFNERTLVKVLGLSLTLICSLFFYTLDFKLLEGL
jgi:hypothetical protein